MIWIGVCNHCGEEQEVSKNYCAGCRTHDCLEEINENDEQEFYEAKKEFFKEDGGDY